VSSAARIVAVRGPPLSSDISPNACPSPRTAIAPPEVSAPGKRLVRTSIFPRATM
jgi:hypothetical protein